MTRRWQWMRAFLSITAVALAALAWWGGSERQGHEQRDSETRELASQLGRVLSECEGSDWGRVQDRAGRWLSRQGVPLVLECVSEQGETRRMEHLMGHPAGVVGKAAELDVMGTGRLLGSVRLARAHPEGASTDRRLEITAVVAWILLSLTAAAGMYRRLRGAEAFAFLWSEERRRVAQTLDFLSTAVAVLDARGAIVFANGAMCGLVGRAEEALRGTSIDALPWYTGNGQVMPGQAAAPDWRLLTRGPEESVKRRVRMTDATGRVRTLDAGCRAVSRSGRVMGLLLVLEDVTDLIEQEAELEKARDSAERANTAKSAFLANMSHDIRTPIHGVIGALDLLSRTELSAVQHTYASAAHTSAESLLHLINDILDFSKIEAGKLELSPREFDLAGCVSEAFKVASITRGDKPIELVLDTAPLDGLRVVGDPDRLRQVVINLVANAIKFTAQGEVRVSSESRRSGGGIEVTLHISDTGIGISPDGLDRLFKPFSQVDASTTRAYGGTGLGLAICRQLLELMGGGVTVTSSPGHGSVFTARLMLPVVRPVEPAEAEADAAPVLEAMVCHYLEPHPSAASAMQSSMGRIGVRAVRHDHLGSLLAAARGLEPDDHAALMVRVDTWGAETAALLHAVRGSARAAQIIAVCRDAPPPGLDPVAERLADALLEKPVGVADLREALDRTRRATARQDSSSAQEERARWGVLAGARVLVAEDHPVSQMIARNFLESVGCHCEIVDTGQRAAQRAATERYDIVLMDCHLPGMDGYAAASAIREHELRTGRPRTPIIALTASAMKNDQDRCMLVGMDGVLTKPLRRAKLADTLANLLGAASSRVSGQVDGGGKTGDARAAGTLGPEGGSVAHGAPCGIEPSFSAEALLARSLGDAALASRLLELFEQRTLEDVHELRAALDQCGIDRARAIAHSIAGGAAQVGAERIMELARRIEHEACADVDQMLKGAHELVREVDLYLEHARAWAVEHAAANSARESASHGNVGSAVSRPRTP